MKRILSVVLVVIAILSFTACPSKKPTAGLKLDKDSFGPGSIITVFYKAPADYPKDAWIGIIPSSVKHGDETENDKHDITYKYLNNSTSGKMTFVAPKKPGSYDLRMHNTDNGGVEVSYVTFSVVGEEKEAVKGTSKYPIGTPVMVEWKGKWWPAKVIAVGKKSWKIHYDGYSNSWDEWVGPKRIKLR